MNKNKWQMATEFELLEFSSDPILETVSMSKALQSTKAKKFDELKQNIIVPVAKSEELADLPDDLTNHLYSVWGVLDRLRDSKDILTESDIASINTIYKMTPWSKYHLSLLIRILNRVCSTTDLTKNEHSILDHATSFIMTT